MNALMIDMLVKAKQSEMNHEVKKYSSFASRQAGDRGAVLRKLAFGLAIARAIILMTVWAIGAV